MSLRSWLRRTPQPTEVRVITEDDEEKVIKLSSDVRNRWKGAEDAIYSARARTVQCLDSEGAIIRAMKLETDADGNEIDDSEALAKRFERELKGERRELGMVLDRYGHRLNEAFERGAQAASVSQDNLVNLVTTLTNQLGIAIMNVHNLSLQYAAAIQQGGDEERGGGSDALLRTVLGGAVSRAMGGNGAGVNGQTNGKSGGKRKEHD